MKPTLLLLVLAHAASAGAGVRHVPPAGAETGAAIELVAEAPATTPTLVAHVRPTGQAQYTEIELVRRDEGHWVAVVPPTAVAPPGIDYYIAAGDEAVFATPEWPHTLPVRDSDEIQRKARDVVRSQNRRSQIHTMGEWVDYGTRTVGVNNFVDRYYRIDADFAYKLWSYPLEEIRVGYTRLLGNTLPLECQQMVCQGQTMVPDAGFKVGGWFELGLAPIEGIRFDARAIVMATQDGFAVGGRGEGRIGVREGNHVAVGVEYLATVGTAGYFRLGWGTVPKLPMSATVEITNLPASYRETGVRLYYDIAREVATGVKLGVRVGYAARVQAVAGITGGAGATVEF